MYSTATIPLFNELPPNVVSTEKHIQDWNLTSIFNRSNTVKWILWGAHVNWEPDAQSIKVFFFKRYKLLAKDRGLSGLKGRGFGDSATCRPSEFHWKTIVNIKCEAQAVWDKFFKRGHYVKKSNPLLPVGGRFFGRALATMTGKRTKAQTIC